MKETPEFADEILSALRVKKDYQTTISKAELQAYWHRISDSSFGSRVRIFFDMYIFYFISIYFVLVTVNCTCYLL